MAEEKIDVKIAENKEVAYWERLVNQCKQHIDDSTRSIEVDQVVLAHAEKRLAEEKAKV